jgi:hypothetical protein
MQNYSIKTIKSTFFIIISSCVLFGCVKHASTTPAAAEIKMPEKVTVPMRVENISRDYAKVHSELMKKDDEAAVSSF